MALNSLPPDLKETRDLILGSVGRNDPARAAAEAIANDPVALRDLVGAPGALDGQLAALAANKADRRTAHAARSEELLATKGEQAIIDAWVADGAPANQTGRRNWAEDAQKGRPLVLRDAGRDEATRVQKEADRRAAAVSGPEIFRGCF